MKVVMVGGIVGALGACPSQGYPTGELTKKTIKGFDESGRNRDYYVHVPKNYDNSKPVPLHVTFHGLNAPCIKSGGTYNILKDEAEKRGYILVAPCGSSSLLGVGYNAGTCCGFNKNSKVDEFAFVREVIDDVSSKLCVDPEKIWASGFSNGAMLSEVLACKMGDVFKAVTSVSGVVELRPGNEGGLQACDDAVNGTAKRAAVLNVHGNADPVVPWQSDPVLGFPGIPKDMQAWADRSGCKTDPVTIFEQGKYTIQRWSDCMDGKHMDLVKVAGGGHAWPHDADFDTTTYLHDFFYNASGMPLDHMSSAPWAEQDAPVSSPLNSIV